MGCCMKSSVKEPDQVASRLRSKVVPLPKSLTPVIESEEKKEISSSLKN